MTSLIIRRALVQNYAKKFKNWDCELEKIFCISLFSFWKLKGHKIRIYNVKYTSLNKKITRRVKVDILEKKCSKRAKFTNDRIVRLNRYEIRTNHPFHLKFCTVAPYILTHKRAKIVFEFCTNLCHDINHLFKLCEKFAKIKRGIICNPCVCPTGYEFRYLKSIVYMST